MKKKQCPETSNIALCVVFVCSLCISCSAESVIVINTDYSGELDLEIAVSEILLYYYQDITGNFSAETVFDLPYIIHQFESRNGITIADIEQEQNLQLRLAFENINEFLQSELEETENFLTIRNVNNERKRLSFQLSTDLIQSILSLGFIQNNAISNFLLPNTERNASEYKADLIWALEEYEAPETLNAILENSSISLSFVLSEEPISTSQGATVLQNNSTNYVVTFAIPILDILTLSEQREFFIVY